MGLILALLVGAALLFIHFYTGHGDPLVKVPQIEGMRIDKAVRALEDGGFDYEITDTVYRDEVPLLAIIDQNPEAGFKVKQGRKVYLVLNSDVIPNVSMPDLAGKASYKQAVRILENRGLSVGNKIERPIDEIKDPNSEPVIEQRYAGKDQVIEPGTSIQRHSKVDLVVGIMRDRDKEEGDMDPESGTAGDEGDFDPVD